MVQFDLAWDNSWRTSSGPSNWDAAWVFIKYRVKGQADWRHASLNWADGSGSGDGHTVPAGAVIKGDIDTADGNSLGVFIYSSANKNQSSANYPGVQLRWQYGEDAVQDSDLLEIYVFGIEMVYVPQGAFEVGNMTAFHSAFYTYPTEKSAFTILSEASIAVGQVNGRLYYDFQGDMAGPIPASFPKGYRGFYCMKYEITQEQYVEFLLKLNSTQAFNRAYTSGGNRNGIVGGFGTYTTTYPYVPCNYLSWPDLGAYLDWSALRPMTELEFEKACRGPLPSIPWDNSIEYAWGPTRASENYSISNGGMADESISANFNISAGNVVYESTDGENDGPLRAGIFAAHPNNNGRATAGATFYGIMEMSGNVREQTVSVGHPNGRGFTHSHGDGILDANGNHNVFSWPVADALGMGQRGGGWSSTLVGGLHIAVSSRTIANIGLTTRENYAGGRGVRTAP